MGYSVAGTSAAQVRVAVLSPQNVADLTGEDAESDAFTLALDDEGNMFAFLLSGDSNDWRKLAARIVRAADRDDRLAARDAGSTTQGAVDGLVYDTVVLRVPVRVDDDGNAVDGEGWAHEWSSDYWAGRLVDTDPNVIPVHPYSD